jgi:hypothetical protein
MPDLSRPLLVHGFAGRWSRNSGLRHSNGAGFHFSTSRETNAAPYPENKSAAFPLLKKPLEQSL